MNELARTWQVVGSLSRRSLTAAVVVVLVIAVAQADGPGAALASGGGPEMELAVREGGTCSGSHCYARAGQTFRLSVDAVTAPAQKYIAFQTHINFGGTFDWNGSEDGAGPGSCADGIDLIGDGRDYFDSECTAVDIPYEPAADVGDELVWPAAHSALIVRSPGVHARVIHGAISGFAPPIPESTWEGEIVKLQMNCPATAAQSTITLHPYGAVLINTNGSVFTDINQDHYIPKTNAITMHCVEATAGDYDGDGCSDAAENGATAATGGDRNFVNPWDFYDVAGPGGPSTPDGVVDLSNDYMQVAGHYAPTGAPPYDAHYDRGPKLGANSWNDTQPPDGVIDLANDILGVIGQIGHSCA